MTMKDEVGENKNKMESDTPWDPIEANNENGKCELVCRVCQCVVPNAVNQTTERRFIYSNDFAYDHQTTLCPAKCDMVVIMYNCCLIVQCSLVWMMMMMMMMMIMYVCVCAEPVSSQFLFCRCKSQGGL